MARRFLPSIRANTAAETKAYTSTAVTLTGRTGGGSIWRSWGGSGQDRAAGWDMDAVISEGYERSVWTYRCVELYSGSQSRLPFRIGRDVGGDDQDLLTDHPLYRVLNVRANPLETGKAFRKRLSAQVLLSKKGAFVEVTKSRAGLITRVDLLDPGRVEIIKSDHGEYIDHFQYTRPDGVVVEIDPTRVRWVREPHPTDPFCGTTPLEAAGISIELDQLSRQYNVAFIRNDSRPGGVLAVDTHDLTDQEMDRLESRFRPGSHNAGQLSIVGTGPGGVTYIDTTTRPRDMAYGEASRNSKMEILSAFGVGESLLGNASGSTFNNSEIEEYNFWTKPMPPHLDLVAGAFAEDVDRDGYEPFFDTSGIDALEVGARKRREEARAEYDAGLRSIDEYRPLADLEPVRNPQTRALWVSPSKAPIPTIKQDESALLGAEGGGPAGDGPPAGPPEGPQTAGEAVAAARAITTDEATSETPRGPASQVVADAMADGEDTPTAGPAAEAVAAASEPNPMPWLVEEEPGTGPDPAAPSGPGGVGPLATEVVDLAMQTKAAASAANRLEVDPDLGARNETTLTAALTNLLARQQGVVTARLNSPKQRRGTRHWVPMNAADPRVGTAGMDMAAVVDPAQWAEETVTALGVPLQTAAVDTAGRTIEALAAMGVLAVPAGWVAGEAVQLAGQAVRAVVLAALVAMQEAITEMAGQLVDALEDAQGSGAGIDALLAVVGDFYTTKGPRFVRDVAGDHAHGITMGATDAVLGAIADQHADDVDEGRVVIEREWVSRRDTRVRPTHADVDGTVLPVGERFQVGAAMMLYPQDPVAPPQERYGCRCNLHYRIRAEAPLTLPDPAATP